VDVSGRFLFVANNANTANGNSVSAFSIDPDTGVLTPVPGSLFAASPFPLFVATDPSGQYVYVGLDNSGEANSAASSRDDGDLSFESRHLLCSFTFGCVAVLNICTYRFTFFQNHRA
jgi:DNA-binding beta-propeller fold protein YncE